MTNIVLTKRQQEIFDTVTDKVHNFPGRYEANIVGWAGTGKSTLITEIIKNLCFGYNIAVTSPTHKANHVLRNMLQSAGVAEDDTEIMTIHSFLGLKLVYKKSRQVLQHDPRAKNSNKMVDILIVDECSMISKELYQHLMTQTHRVRRAIIFVGDSCQLQPVEEDSNENDISLSFGYGESHVLDEVLRQALDNPIIKLATNIRECIGTANDPMKYLYNDDNSNIITIEDDKEFLDLYKSYVKSNSVNELYEKVQENKIIAYTNFRVDLSNITIRHELFPDKEDEIFIGEPIVFETSTEHCPYKVQEMITCPEIQKESFMGIDCWKMKSKNGSYILIVGPVSKMDLNDKLQELVSKINAGERNPLTKQPYMWQDYYIIKDKINIVNYPYATTAHKSQGSTFDNIWFDTDFIARIPDNDVKCRIMYTALTRPRYTIIMK